MVRIFILILGTLFIACTHHWIAIPQNIQSFERCKSLNDGPQMLKVPRFEKVYAVIRDCSVMDRQRVAIAMHLFLDKWKEQYPYNAISNKKVEKAFNSLIIEFDERNKTANAYTIDGTYARNLPVSGLTSTPGSIWVKTHPGERICQTSFVHELAHVAIWALKGTDADPDHLGNRYTGWEIEHNIMIQETNGILCEWGI